MGELYRGLLIPAGRDDSTEEPLARVIVVEVADVAAETCRRHQAGETAAYVAGELLATTALLGGQIKGNEHLSVQVVTSGPVGTLMADVSADGHLRASIQDAKVVGVGATPFHRARWSVVGRGQMVVIKSHGATLLYRGTADLKPMGISATVENYLLQSEQIPSVVDVWVGDPGPDGVPTKARGLLVQMLGGADRERATALLEGLDRRHLRQQLAAPAVTTVLEEGFAGYGVQLFPQTSLTFCCTCSMSRAVGAMSSLGADDLEKLLEEQGQGEITCNFCKAHYVVDRDVIATLITRLRENEAYPSQGDA